MALSNIFAQGLQKSQKLQNIHKPNEENPMNAGINPFAQAPVSIFGTAPAQKSAQTAGGPGERAKEIITKVKKMDKFA